MPQASAPHSPRVSSLLRQMTPAEKWGQLQTIFRPSIEDTTSLVRRGLGATFWPRSAAASNALQRVAIEETRLGIPLLIALDVIHGQRTITPIPLAQAATFDTGLVAELARLAATEARSGGVAWTFSPMVDVSRDPRWGRVSEGFGEDVHLTAAMGRAMVAGYQGDDLSAATSIAATAKHFVAYGQPEGGRDYNTVDLSETRLRGVYLEPFRAVVDAGAASVMAAFNTVSGTPMHANRRLLTGVLKREWGFDGVLVGDAEGVRNLIAHRIAENTEDAVAIAYEAGLDVEMGGAPWEVADAARADLISPERLDDAVARVLTLKERLGLFENPYTDESAELTAPADQARTLARRAAARSAVLLTNDGILPLSTPRRILLTGPYARSRDHLGAWSQSFGAPAGTIADSLTHRLPQTEVRVVDGVGFLDDDTSGIRDAIAASGGCDVIVVCAGEPSTLSGEAASRSDLRLPGRQEDLIHALAATGVPVVVVLENGRPLVISDWAASVSGILEAWHGGTEAADAIVDLLLGDAEPAGRLPMSFPRSSSQVPIYYAHENTGRPATTGGTMTTETVDIGIQGPDQVHEKYTSKYLDLELGPLFSFGHGSGYARFARSAPAVSRASVTRTELDTGETVTVTITTTNMSERAGDDVILVFVEDVVASIAPPVRRLVAFARRTLNPGESEVLEFSIGAHDLGFWRTDEGGVAFGVEEGRFHIHVGGSLDDTRAVEVVIA